MPIYNDLPFHLGNIPLLTLNRATPVEHLDLPAGLEPHLNGLAGLLTSLMESRRHMPESEVDAALELLSGQASLCALVLQHWSRQKFPGPVRPEGGQP